MSSDEDLKPTLFDAVRRNQEDYDPAEAIKAVSKVQLTLLEELSKYQIDDIAKSNKLLTAIIALTDGINSNANAVIKNSIDASKGHSSELVDEIVAKLRENGLSTITVTETSTRNSPRDISVDGDYESIDESMLRRGLIDNNYDSFAKEHGLLNDDE